MESVARIPDIDLGREGNYGRTHMRDFEGL
jgi:hypothetical protein